jgi:LysM repeat protein
METIENRSKANFVATLGLTAVVSLTILLALFLAEADSYQQRLVEPPTVPTLPVVRAQATATASLAPGEPTAVAEVTATSEPASPTPTMAAAPSLTPATMATITATLVVTAVTPSPTPPLASCGPPAGWLAYTVRYGDTLVLLARNTGSTVQEIMEANCLTNTIIYHGTRIYLPSRPPVQVQCGPPQHWEQYIVRPGDTLFSLARSRGITVSQALIGNCRTSTYLLVGQRIFLPPLPATATPPPTATQPPPPPPPPPPPDTPTSPPPTATPTIPPVITPIPTVTPTPIPPTPIPPTPTVMPPTSTPTSEPPTSTPVSPTVEPTPTDQPPMPTETPPPEPSPQP